jgi:N-acyl-D-aspartate/D-glutamate deacylase
MHDLLIKDAHIHDGDGGTPFYGALAVTGGRIEGVGEVSGAARQTIDAGGLVLAPGFIDTHTHYDAQITWDPLARPSPALGVTTVIMGNCGFTIAPCKPANRRALLDDLTHVEGMSSVSLNAGVEWDFETFPQYLDSLERRGVGPNVACYVGHSSVRSYVMGAAAFERQANAKEIASMAALVREGMAAGAIGFSTTTSLQHNCAAGTPMPSRLAGREEMLALAAAMGESGRGVMMMTKSGDTKIADLEAMAVAAQRPFLVAALLYNPVTPDASLDDLNQIAAARARGVTMHGAVSCTPLSFEFAMTGAYPLEGLQSWRPALQTSAAELPQLLRNTAFRQSIKDEIAKPIRRLFNGNWDRIRVVQTKLPQHRAYEGRTIAELAGDTDALDWMFDLALREDLETLFVAGLLNADEQAVAKHLSHPASLLSLSDAGAHLTFFCDAGYALHFLGHWVRDKKLLELPAAIHRLTAQAAAAFGISERGRLRPGYWADLCLFDPVRVGRGPQTRVFDLPAQGSRLDTPAQGVHGVWVNGHEIAGETGIQEATAGRPGKVLRRFDASA